MKHVLDLGFFFAVLLHCGQVRRLRIQQRMKSEEKGATAFDDNEEMLEYTSSIPLLPPLTAATLQQYFASCLSLVAGIILFGGLIAPIVRLFIDLLVFHTLSHHVKLKRMSCKNLKPAQSKIKHL
jgi:hypothetical protein